MFKIEEKAKVQLPEPVNLTQHMSNRNSHAHLNYENFQTEEQTFPEGINTEEASPDSFQQLNTEPKETTEELKPVQEV